MLDTVNLELHLKDGHKMAWLNYIKKHPLLVNTNTSASENHESELFWVQYIVKITMDTGALRIFDVAAAIYRKSGIWFLVTGTDSEEKNLGRAIEERGLQKLVSPTGYVNELRKIDLLHKARLLMYQSEKGTFRIWVGERMFSKNHSKAPYGLPFAYQDNMDVSELNRIDFSSLDEIARAVDRYSSDWGSLGTIGEAARKFVRINFNMDKNCDTLLSSYTDLLSGKAIKAVLGNSKSIKRLPAG